MDQLTPVGNPAPAVTQTQLPPQPTWTVNVTDWADYDVPRIWDSLSCLNHPETWEQAQNVARYADRLNAQAEDLERLRERLSAAWSGGRTPAAAAALGRIGALIVGLRADALAAATTARGVNGVLEAMSTAKQQLEPIVDRYFKITEESHPYAWRSTAMWLNEQAREVMLATEKAISDGRANIVISRAMAPFRAADVDLEEPQPTVPRPAGRRDTWPHVTPGDRHVSVPSRAMGSAPGAMSEDDGEFRDGPMLGGIPVPPISAGEGSVLPIFPGNPYAPGGGAYVLPGGTGNGYVLPMQPPWTATSSAGTRGGSSVPGMMPLPTPMAGRAGSSDADRRSLYRQGTNTRWEVPTGGPSVIEPPSPAAEPREAASSADEFREWYTAVAMPWRFQDGTGEPAPTVTIRRGGK
jgi:hypothetical protein